MILSVSCITDGHSRISSHSCWETTFETLDHTSGPGSGSGEEVKNRHFFLREFGKYFRKRRALRSKYPYLLGAAAGLCFPGREGENAKSCKTKTKNQKITFSNPSNFRYNTLDSCGNGVKREKKTEIFGRIAENCITLFALFLEGPPRKCCLYLK